MSPAPVRPPVLRPFTAGRVASHAPPGTPATGPAFLTSVAGTGAGQYLADQYGAPYLLRWEAVWALVVNAGNSGGATTWESDITNYCATRAAQGWNGLYTTATANAEAGIGAYNNGNTWDNVAPFSSPGVLNNTFWLRVDHLLDEAEANGLTVALGCMFTYAIYNTGGPLNGWTTTQCGNFGTAVGTRYASRANLIWQVGDDYGGSWVGGQIYDDHFTAFLNGLRGAGANQLISIENESECSARYSMSRGQASFAWGQGNADWNWCYTYGASYLGVEDAYKEAADFSTSHLPVVHMDGWFDNQWGGHTPSETIELYGRKWVWWVLSSGSRGIMYGQEEAHRWPSGCIADGYISASPGSQFIQPAALNTAWEAFMALDGWHLLAPDTGSTLVTAGRGTRASEFGAGAGSSNTNLYVGGNTWVTASFTADGALAVAYIPTGRTVTVDDSHVTAGYASTWVDPASGATSTATSGGSAGARTFDSSAKGNNSAGDGDWVLVLQGP